MFLKKFLPLYLCLSLTNAQATNVPESKEPLQSLSTPGISNIKVIPENAIKSPLWQNVPVWRMNERKQAEVKQMVQDSLEVKKLVKASLSKIDTDSDLRASKSVRAKILAENKIEEIKKDVRALKQKYIAQEMEKLTTSGKKIDLKEMERICKVNAAERIREELLPTLPASASEKISSDYYFFLSLTIEKSIAEDDPADFKSKYAVASSVYQQSLEKSYLDDMETRKKFLLSLDELHRFEIDLIREEKDTHVAYMKQVNPAMSKAIFSNDLLVENSCPATPTLEQLTNALDTRVLKNLFNVNFQDPAGKQTDVPPLPDPVDALRQPGEKGSEVPIPPYPRGEHERETSETIKTDGQINVNLTYPTAAGNISVSGGASISYTKVHRAKAMIYSYSDKWPIFAEQTLGSVKVNDLNYDESHRLVFNCIFEDVVELEAGVAARLKLSTPGADLLGVGADISAGKSKNAAVKTTVRRITPVRYVPMLQKGTVAGVERKTSIRDINDYCNELYKSYYEKSIAKEMEVALKAYEYYNPQSQCPGANPTGDAKCKQHFEDQNTFPSVLSSTAQRCIEYKDKEKAPVYYCRFRSIKDRACSMRDADGSLLTSGMFEYPCDTGLVCQFTYIPGNAVTRFFNHHKAECKIP